MRVYRDEVQRRQRLTRAMKNPRQALDKAPPFTAGGR